MEQAQQNTAQELTAQAIPQQAVEDACFHSLGLIGRNCEYLEQHLARVGADAQSLQAVSDISAATAKLERTINELLSALEFLRAGQPPKLYPLDLCELLQQVAAQADMVRAQLGVTLELDYGGWTTCRVLADRDDVELLCLHLLSNALRACREGGTVGILLRRSETMWQLTVRDNGCGLPEGSQEAWLENRRSFLGGAQLGLLLCRECCRRMGWGLSVECAPEKGTQAVVTVPLYTDDGRAPEVELHAGADLAAEQHQYQLRAMHQHGSGLGLGGRQIHVAVVAALHFAGTGHGTLKGGHKAEGLHGQLQSLRRGQAAGQQVKAGAAAHGAHIDHTILEGTIACVGGKQVLQRVGSGRGQVIALVGLLHADVPSEHVAVLTAQVHAPVQLGMVNTEARNAFHCVALFLRPAGSARCRVRSPQRSSGRHGCERWHPRHPRRWA